MNCHNALERCEKAPKRFFEGKPEAEGLPEENLEGAFSQCPRALWEFTWTLPWGMFYLPSPEAFPVFNILLKTCSQVEIW